MDISSFSIQNGGQYVCMYMYMYIILTCFILLYSTYHMHATGIRTKTHAGLWYDVPRAFSRVLNNMRLSWLVGWLVIRYAILTRVSLRRYSRTRQMMYDLYIYLILLTM